MKRFAATLLLSGCATTGGTYERGTYTRPPPPTLRPGHGAPAVGQPGQVAPNVPRSPNVRVLPADPQPGLWAADEVRAAKRKRPELEAAPPDIPPPTVAGVELLVSGADISRLEAYSCAVDINELLKSEGQMSSTLSLQQDRRACVVAMLYEYCLETRAKVAKSEARQNRLLAILEAGRNFRLSLCRKNLTLAMNDILREVKRAWILLKKAEG